MALPTFLIAWFITSSLMSMVGPSRRPWPLALPQELQALDIGARTRTDPHATTRASTDFGRMVQAPPAAVLYPSSVHDIMTLVQFSYSSSKPAFTIASRGHGHSVRGQALAPNGVVIEMTSMRSGCCGGGGGDDNPRISVLPGGYVDAGGEQFWIDVLQETLKYGLAPKSWTDYLYLTVGGTLSNAGISGQAFLHGPQISNVYELDVITGKGEMVTCSEDHEPDLFFAVLGGLGQFGIITRARIALEPAPQMVRWVRLIYTNFEAFSRDQEELISLDDGRKEGFNYVEGSILMDHNVGNNWRSSFFSERDLARISSLAARYGAVYCLEGARYYDKAMVHMVDQELESLLEGLSFVPGFAFENDVTYIGFLNRVHGGELKLRSQGLWNVPHPWLNILVPRSRIIDFDQGVFKFILRHHNSTGPVLIYPMNRNKWDGRTSAVIPDEEVFYSIGLLWSGMHEWESLEDRNRKILHFCKQAGIKHKQYLPHYRTRADWIEHFGSKWDKFVERKRRYDPKALLSPGQQIFTSSLVDNSSSEF